MKRLFRTWIYPVTGGVDPFLDYFVLGMWAVLCALIGLTL